MVKIKIEYVANKEDDGKKVGNVIRDKLSVSSRLLNKLKMNGKIFVNGNSAFSSAIIHKNDVITVNIDFEENDNIEVQNIPLKIIYEDEYFLAVNKEAGMVVHPSSYHLDGTLANGIKYYLNNKKKIRPINRLDRDTSGIVLFAKNEYIQELMANIEEIKKEYIAICIHKLPHEKGIINAPIARREGSIMERCVCEEGQEAITHYELLKYDEENDLSYVKLILETGRTHQIRVHLSYIGSPILGDTLYGSSSDLIDRQALHAHKLSFIHPITKKKIEIIAEIPEDMLLSEK